MSGYLTDLVVCCVDDLAEEGRGVWKVMQPFKYYSSLLNQVIVVEEGFLTDFASVPRLPVLYWLFGDTCHKAAVLHDWLFHHHEVCTEITANKVLLEAAEAEGIPKWRRTMIYFGVAVGGKSSWIEDARGLGHSIKGGRIV